MQPQKIVFAALVLIASASFAAAQGMPNNACTAGMPMSETKIANGNVILTCLLASNDILHEERLVTNEGFGDVVAFLELFDSKLLALKKKEILDTLNEWHESTTPIIKTETWTFENGATFHTKVFIWPTSSHYIPDYAGRGKAQLKLELHEMFYKFNQGAAGWNFPDIVESGLLNH